MRVTFALIATLGGASACAFHPGGTAGDDDAIDAGVDACDCPLGCTAAGACRTFTPSNPGGVDLLDGVTAALDLAPGNYVIDSEQGQIFDGSGLPITPAGVATMRFTDPGDPGLWVIAVDSLHVAAGANVRARGIDPIKILVRGDALIEGVIDVGGGCASGEPSCAGPGGGIGGKAATAAGDHRELLAAGCGAGGIGAAGSTRAEAGGGGAGFGGAGAAGGNGGSDGGGTGGAVCGTDDLIPLLGGSGGGGAGYWNSGSDDNRTSGGGGGGGLQITSLRSITVAAGGAIDAAGAGGAGTRGPSGGDGGGGGGSGGGVLLEAPAITIGGTVTAHGGGGGAGIDLGNRNGLRGLRQRVRAGGGVNEDQSGGGAGGIGLISGETSDPGAAAGDGGSGGGGGGGRLRFNTVDGAELLPSAVASPPPSAGTIVADP